MPLVKSVSRQKLYKFFERTAATIIKREIVLEDLVTKIEADKEGKEPTRHHYQPPRGNKPGNQPYKDVITRTANTFQAFAIAASEGAPYNTYNKKDPSLTAKNMKITGEALERLQQHFATMKDIDATSLFERKPRAKRKQAKLAPVLAA